MSWLEEISNGYKIEINGFEESDPGVWYQIWSHDSQKYLGRLHSTGEFPNRYNNLDEAKVALRYIRQEALAQYGIRPMLSIKKFNEQRMIFIKEEWVEQEAETDGAE